MATTKEATNRCFRVGAVGYGGAFNMGRLHLISMAKNKRMEVAAVCELDPARRAVATEDFPGIKTYGSVGNMLRSADLDLGTIITPHNTHAKLAVQCLSAGVNVVCEKPLAITSAEVKQIAEEHLDRIDRKITELTEMRATLSHLVDACAGDHPPDCPILADLAMYEKSPSATKAAI